MKYIKILIILLISSFSYYGVVNDKGEKVTNIQEIMQEQQIENSAEESFVEENAEKIEIVGQEIVVEEIEKTEKEESKEVVQQEKEKKEKTATKNQTQKTQPIVNKAQEKTTSTETTKSEKTDVEQKEEIKKQENNSEKKQEEKVVTNAEKCANGNHGMSVGNSKKWFKSESEAIATYEAEIEKWGNKWTNDEITKEEYYAKCPYGYETWNCPYCNLYTLNYYYDN